MSYTRWNALRAIAGFSATCSRYSQNVPSQCCSRNLLTARRRSIRPTRLVDPALLPPPVLLLLLVLLMAMSVSLRLCLNVSAESPHHEGIVRRVPRRLCPRVRGPDRARSASATTTGESIRDDTRAGVWLVLDG